MNRIFIGIIFMMTTFSVNLYSQDFDLDGVPDAIDVDDDNDGLCDSVELSSAFVNYVRNCDAPVSGTHRIGPTQFVFNNYGPGVPIDSGGSGSSTCPGSTGWRQFRCRTDLGGSHYILYSFLPGGDSLSFTTDISGTLCHGFEVTLADIDRDDGLYFVAYSGGSIISADSIWKGPGIKDSLNFYWDTTGSSGSFTDSLFQTRWYFNSGTCVDSIQMKFYSNKTTCQTSVNNLLRFRSMVLDSDGDGLSDQFDTDADGDGCYDVLEAFLDPALDLDGDGIAGDGIETVDGSGLPTIMGGSCQAVNSFTYRDSNIISSACDTILPGNELLNINEDNSGSVAVLANNSDINGDSMFVTVVNPTTAAGASAVFQIADSTILYTPVGNFCGQDEVYYEVCDSTIPVLCIVDTIFVNVACVNDTPTGGNENSATLEDFVSGNVNLLSNNADVDNDSLVLVINPISPNGGTISSPSAGVIVYNPTPNWDGIDTIIYQVCDTVTPALCVTDTLFMTVIPNNDQPQINNDSAVVSEDNTIIIDPLINDSDSNDVLGGIDSTSVDTIPSTGPFNGMVSIDPVTGQLTYTPNLNFNGLDSFRIEVCDTGYPLPALCRNSLVYIEVLPLPDPPMSAPEYVTIDEDSSLTSFDVLSNNIDPEGDSIIAGAYPGTSTQGFPVGQNPDGTLDYSPPSNWYGMDTIVINVCDTTGLCNTDTVFITVTPVNDAPITTNDTLFIIQSGDTLNACVSFSDPDLPEDSLVCNVISGPINGTWTSTSFDCFSYIPDSGWIGNDTITKVICDTAGLCDTSIIVISSQLNPILPPSISDDSVSMNEDDTLSYCLTITDPNLPNDSVYISSIGNPNNGITDSISPYCINYIPNTNWFGLDTIMFVACDTSGQCDTAWLIVNVLNVSDAPVNGNENITIDEDSVISSLDLTINNSDPDGDSILVNLPITSSAGSNIVINADGTIGYTPPTNFHGMDTVWYMVCDTTIPQQCVQDTLFITLNPVNDLPIVNNDSVWVDEDGQMVFNPLTNDTDSNDVLGGINISSLDTVPGSGPFNGNISIDPATGDITYIPNANFNGLDSFQVIVCDTGFPQPPLCDTSWTIIVVNSINDIPVALNDTNQVDYNGSTTIDVLNNDTDDDGDSLSVSIFGNPINGTATIVNGMITYSPDSGFCGWDVFLYLACDASDCDTALVLVEVVPADTDGDGIVDHIDGFSDFDGDGLANYLDTDSDNDGISDAIEGPGDLSDICNQVLADTDGDLSPDYLDNDSDGDGLGDQLEVTDSILDTDGDGLLDFRDPDSDNDGIGDLAEYDADENGVVDDCDNDGTPDWLDADECTVQELVIPEAFSPDGDGKNDLLEFPGLSNFESNSLLIFNRWGNKVFEASPYNNDWDAISSGNLNTGSGKVPAGTYYYVLDLGDGSDPKSGYIYISY
ncbi:MAG: Ig-like domain-containing protein, partial [Flavobacteriales bacterium]|nr:Ig-like domain-containing protein [Flavobacteriales bacterium]